MFSLVAVDKNWGIGKDNRLPWKIPGEQRFFKGKTMGGIIVMGRKTLESLPGGKPLPGRRNIVLSRNENFSAKGVEIIFSPEQLLKLVHNEDPKKVFLIGGAQIYRLLTPYCMGAYVTKVTGDYEVDTYHPNLDRDSGWRIADISPEVVSSNGISYVRYIYENKFLNR